VMYSKLKGYDNKMDPKFQKWFQSLSRILKGILTPLSKVFKPYRVGQGLSIDTAQFVLLIMLLSLLLYF